MSNVRISASEKEPERDDLVDKCCELKTKEISYVYCVHDPYWQNHLQIK